MTFGLNETHRMIRQTAREFAAEQLAPGAIERDEKELFPHHQMKALGELGFMGMMVPEEWGGAGLDTVSYVLAMEEISRVDASAGVIMSVNNSLVCYGINKYGSADQKERYLRDLAAGRKLGAFALSEPEAGSDASNQHTTAAADGDAYVLNGTKNWITNGSTADLVLVMSVNPGFGAQKFIPATLDKMKKLAEIRAARGYSYRIEVDGGVGLDTVAEIVRAGAEILVAGNAVFGKGDPKGNAAALLDAARSASLQKV